MPEEPEIEIMRHTVATVIGCTLRDLSGGAA
jgi:hypothetical protein